MSERRIRLKEYKILQGALSVLFLLSMTGGAQAAPYDFYVDMNSTQATEDGSEANPWKTISAAISNINSNNFKDKSVFIKNGTYAESLTVTGNTKLIGESKSGTVLDADGHQNAVNFVSTVSEIQNLTVKNAEATAVIIDKKSKVTIDNCSIEKAGKYGVDVNESTAAEKYKFTIRNSEVSESSSQGLYISRRKISVADNEIFDNDEEGVDLHQGVKGKVNGNHIHGNGESGIESILTSANFTLRGNNVENNHTQGITVQIYSASRSGKVKITGNTIKGNHDHGIRLANYTRKLKLDKFKKFAGKYVKISKNSIKNNGHDDTAYD